MSHRHARLVMPHQLFREHLQAPRGTTFVLVEHDLMFRQYRFHAQKLILHRASMRRFADLLAENGYDVVQIDTDAGTTSRAALERTLRKLNPSVVSAYDVVDDWLGRDLAPVVTEWLETPNFVTDRHQLRSYFGAGTTGRSRMLHFYAWQRRRLDILVENGEPVGGRWSFDKDNRKRLPRGYQAPPLTWPRSHRAVTEAINWVAEAFPDAPGDPDAFAWPTSHEEAEAMFADFVLERFADFGPYEDAISREHRFINHSLITPALNIGLLSPRDVVERALEAQGDVPLASLEGFVRQVIGWREYMRATHVLWGRGMRTANHLAHTRGLGPGWWSASTGLTPVDLVIERVLERGWAHHIERLMVLGNAMCLLRVDPDAVYEWFMEMFVDSYDWVMVPNVYAMSQFASGSMITTKPYVSGSHYLRTMSDLPAGDWEADWDALWWTFVRDHHDVFAGNPRARMMAASHERLGPDTKATHARRAQVWLSGSD